MSTRPAFVSQTSQTRRREPSFPSFQTRGSSTAVPTLASPAAPGGAWGVPAPTNDAASTQQNAAAAHRKKGPSLSLALSSGEAERGAGAESIHPLKYTWDVWFSHRSAGANGGKNGKKEEAIKTGKEKESREEWEGGVVKLGGFSSIESLHPFLAHLAPPSTLPSSIASSAHIFNSSSPDFPPSSNNITDYNVFRSPIAPAWEDPANTGGGRWVLRLRKGVADRVWEEVVFALVGERIGGDDDRVENKVNGVVLSVRKDEDILSLWCAPSSRAERDIIRDALRTALEPLLTATSAANLVLDYKPHPAPAGSHSAAGFSGNSSLPRDGLARTESPHRHHREHTRERSDNASNGGERRGAGDRASSRSGGGFSSYTSRAGAEPRERSVEPFSGVGAIGSGAVGTGFGRTRRGSVGKTEGEARAPSSTSWGRA